jgi:hypothetical protein
MINTVKKMNDALTNEFSGYFVTLKNSDAEMCVPLDSNNTDYQNILEWEKIEGNTIEEAD